MSGLERIKGCIVITDGPGSVNINPQLPANQTLYVRDGDYVGPYNCSADCNPPCVIQWKYKLSNGTFRDAESEGGTLTQQQVFRDKALFQCVVTSSFNKTLQTTVICESFCVLIVTIYSFFC